MAAAALDAADGVIDGRHFGRPIVQAGPSFGGFGQPAFGGFAQPAFGGFAQTAFAQPVQSFGAPAFGTTFGATQFPGAFGAPTQFLGGVSSTAAALDAADGVLDGRHFGRPIVQAGGFQAPVAFGGAPFAQRPAFFGGQQFGATQFVGAPTFGATQFGAPAFGGFGGVSSTAAALDAADGVLDGRHFGRPIVQAGAAPIASYGTAFGAPAFGGATLVGAPAFGGFGAPVAGSTFVGAPAFGGSTLVGAPAFGGFGAPVATQFGGFGGFPAAQQFGGFPGAFGVQSRAAQLDAADGVIDGRFYGRPIVQRR